VSTFEARLAKAKSRSLLQSIFRSSRLLQALAVERKQIEFPGPQPRTPHAALYAHISLGGTRPTTLASKLGITPQAVAQLVGELESMGLVERVPDPEDGRARLVRFTDKGRQDILAGFDVFAAIEREIRSELGARDFDRLLSLAQRLEAIATEMATPSEG